MKRLIARIVAWWRSLCTPADEMFLPEPSRPGLLFGYYGDGDKNLEETRDHVNLAWVFGWGSATPIVNALEHLQAARAYGIRNVVLGITSVWLPGGEQWLREYLQALSDRGLLRDVKALYPIDEPNDGENRKSNQDVVAVNQMVRSVARSFPELAGVALAVIYGADNDDRPGLGSYDWAGIDRYEMGARILGSPYDKLKAALRPDQRILLVPGGAEPWKNDPGAFYNRAQQDHQVIAIAAFVWQDNVTTGVGAGIRSNPTRARYVEAGSRIKSTA